jgi:trimeric autotransporter adhesin
MKSFLPIISKAKSVFLLFCIALTYSPIGLFGQDDCTTATALTVSTAPACSATAGTTVGATQSMPGCSGTADDDVWFSFVPNGGAHTITVNTVNPGRINDIVFEVFSGTCGSLTSVVCRNITNGNNAETVTLNGLTNGSTYYVRVYSNANGSGQGNFNICVTKPAPPANDNCSGATNLIPALTCGGGSQTTGTLVNASNSGIAPGVCGGNADDDVWYSFTALNNAQTVTISGLGSNIVTTGAGLGGSAVMEVFSSSNNTCGGTLTNISCGTTVGTNLLSYLSGLTIGNTYFIRVYSTNAVSLPNNASFTICVQNPPANDDCVGAISLTPAATCVSGVGGSQASGTLVNASNSGIAAGVCGGNADDDVWYSFTALNNAQTVTLSGLGSNIVTTGAGLGGSAVMEVFSSSNNTCGGTLTNIACGTTVGTNLFSNLSGLTIGNTYFIRVYSTNAVPLPNNAGFTICVQNPPANDNCAGAISLTPAATCVGGAGGSQASGTLVGASNSGLAGACGGNADDDVWYSFTALNNAQTVTLSGLGSNIVTTGAGLGGSAVMEVFSSSNNTCGGTLTNISCGTTVGTNLLSYLSGLTIGNTYFIRVYSTNAVSLPNNSGFTICVQNPPANDDCVGAISLTPAATCVSGAGGSQASGTLVNASNSGIAAGVCGGNADDDVWYSFAAQYTTQTITLSGIGSNIAVAGTGLGGSAVMEVFASNNNTCGGTLSSIACGFVSGNNLVAYANSLTVGNTYFIRVYSTNAVPLTNNANFNLCIQNPYAGTPAILTGKSFVNVTKGVNGGTVEPGDILEIRASVNVRATAGPGNPTTAIDSCAFFDNIPAGTSFVSGSLAIITNEGKIYKSFSDAMGDDEGSVNGSAIVINMGYNPTDNHSNAFNRGRIRSNHRPTAGGCLMLASYRVVVTAATSSILNLGGGYFTYAEITNPTIVQSLPFNQSDVIVYQNTGLCINSNGVNVLDNTLAGDFDGTFGSGNLINRVASPNVPPGYTYTELTGNNPTDSKYAITNNTSNNAAGFMTTNNWVKPDTSSGTATSPKRRIFGVFDIIGDHTGAADPLMGNPAADTTNGGTGGYMLLVNSAFNLDTAFKYPISGLCPNTYYELSFWIRNMCSRCGNDSMGRGSASLTPPPGYIPTDVGDSSGVSPNLSLSINDINHYTTGNIKYTGRWIKKGFVFRTGAAQTNIEFAITNNAPGGGGNDWVLDDISIATCTPNLNLTPSGNSQVCLGNQVDLTCDVVSFFNNYIYYQWQVSHDNGVTWTDTLAMGTGSPTQSGGNYTYTATFPSFIANASQHFVQYRIRVATTPANLYSGCSFFNSANIIVMVNNCLWVLKTDLLSFTGRLNNKQALLNWGVNEVTEQTIFEIQKSFDGKNFQPIGKMNAVTGLNNYSFTDPEQVSSAAYYRIVVKERDAQKISKTVLLSVKDISFEIVSIVNPFSNRLVFDVTTPNAVTATIIITDAYGKTVKQLKQPLQRGVNNIQVNDLGTLSGGNYYLQISTPQFVQNKKLIKVSK